MIDVKVNAQEPIHINVSIADKVGVNSPTTQIIEREAEIYRGKYTATPDVEPVVLPTKDKLLKNDVTIFKIPLWEVSNTSGTTIYIGGEECYGD